MVMIFPLWGNIIVRNKEEATCLHSIHVAMSEQDIVIKWGIDNFNVNQDGFSPKFYRDILEEPFRG
jgi:hypothetical protein